MSFFTGFFSGFALTASALYITIQVHRSNRHAQKQAIRDQVQAINLLASPRGAYDRRLLPADEELSTRTEGALTPSSPGMKDQLKHQWNEEVRKLARKACDSRWEDVRDTAVEGWRGVKRLVKRD
ncbi:MICOS complex subunit Mic12 family protein [Aspergillus lucknowensis]|uniref:MICOS complex subunit MIC12 n=1 Tax=Aspergillus lucknowensis TaxID=176173 RepID=A0ABR4M6G5_9EURO